MGDMADYYRELALENQFNFSPDYDYDDTDYTTWVTKTGQAIKVVDMTDSHLINTINYINKRANPTVERWFDTLVKEANRRRIITPKKSLYFECDATEADIY